MTQRERLLIAQRLVCAECGTNGAVVKRIATTGTGLTKLIDIQHNQYIGASCGNCGYTEFYNPDMLERKGSLGTILDVLFGG